MAAVYVTDCRKSKSDGINGFSAASADIVSPRDTLLGFWFLVSGFHGSIQIGIGVGIAIGIDCFTTGHFLWFQGFKVSRFHGFKVSGFHGFIQIGVGIA
ncbi:MAG TPA: hypothetical protein P5125_08030, partial [Kiritimatiellia bacterium]|nr:hypothetical protein [Kiritimatiellia bacterium]